jgi:predicted GNAT family acetyltransferase
MESNIFFNPTLSRFEWEIDSYTALAEFRLEQDMITFTHTEVPAELGGRGIGSRLVEFALNYARSQGWKVVPLCPFFKSYIAKHPNYSDLLA